MTPYYVLTIQLFLSLCLYSCVYPGLCLCLSEMVDAARKALISRVEELTSERSALNMELDSCRETISRLEGKTKEMEDEIKR